MVKIKINATLEIPLHLQIETGIKELILEQRCLPGDFLFTEVGLSRDCGISRDSVRQGVNRLVNDGLLERRRAKGVFLARGGTAVRRNRRQLTFVIPDIRHSFYGSMVSGGIAQAREYGYELAIAGTDFDNDLELKILTQLQSMPPHAVIVCTNGGPQCEKALLQLVEHGFGIIMVDRNFPDVPGDTITNDNISIGREAAEYLLQLGHRRIVHASVDVPDDINAELRRQGYAEAMAAAGLEPQYFYALHNGESWLSDSEKNTARWLKEVKNDLPTAIFAVNDTICVGIMRAIVKAGMSVPDDISLLGCADLDLAQAFLDPLSTIDQHSYDMGSRAVYLAIRRLEGHLAETPPIKEIYPHHLIKRKTTCPPYKAAKREKKFNVNNTSFKEISGKLPRNREMTS